MYLASNVKHLRTRQGLTQAELAEQLGKTSAAISDYEKSKSLPPLDVAFRLSELFNVTIDDLTGKDLRQEDLLAREAPDSDISYQSRYARLRKQFQVQERLTELLEHRLAELEREIREHAPELARRLGLAGEGGDS